ncbi:MAG: 3-deoxy-8-phosphooctulonate synthase [Nitrospirae bacterium CG_4_9_14_3_um_filter_51_5]|nr:MAG: 3-deoxy-8-phosphooctulonate synthase [Nitrospirae bacterium CG_4_9_14_3_um_filter_51_5]
MAQPTEVDIGPFSVGGSCPHFLIAGPCVIESEKLVIETAAAIAEIAKDLGIPYIFKASYDKANRTSISSFRGLGIAEGLKILKKIKRELGVPILTDIHEVQDVSQVAEAVDVLQIPAFLCRQTDLLCAAAKSGRVVNVKKGQFLSPWDMANVVNKLQEAGTRKIFLTERGASFGYQNLVVDMRSLPVMRNLGYPVVFDATHSVQLPGGGGTVSSGQREFVAPLARAAAAVGCDGFFMEVHPRPEEALSDGPNMIRLSELRGLLEQLQAIWQVTGKG